jgi:L-ascorbate metabolism protein UlaG (beta-lactamase superfamily)
LRADDIDRADWIVVGHSHFDHLWGAERIAKRTGATIIGSHESVRIMEQEGVKLSQLLPVGGGERIRLSPDVTVTVYPSLHSCVWTPKAGMVQPDEVCLGDLGVTYQERMARLQELMQGLTALSPEVLSHLQASAQGVRGDGGSFVYLFETAEGSLLYQDTSGHWSGILHNLRPDVALLAAAGRGTIDGEPIQGTLAQFVVRQADLLRPRRVILDHKRTAASATIKLPGPANGLRSNRRNPVCWSHSCISSSLFTSPSPVNIWNSPTISAAVEPARLLTAQELRQRVCDSFGCEQTAFLMQQVS